jgi:amino acid transporter
MADQTAPTAPTPVGLRKNAIGLREVLFQSVTDMAPGAAIAASIPAGAALAGGSLPLSVVFALVACLLTASSIAELARHMPTAGSLATYAAQGLHRAIGFLVAWGYVLVGVLIPPLVLLQLGFTTAATLNGEFSGYPADLWWPWTILGAVIVTAAGLYGIRTSARLGTVLGVFEVAVFLVLGAMLIFHAGSANTLSVFSTAHTPDGAGISAVIAGSVFTILAFGGFEGAAPLAEEARDPRRTIRRAVLGATLGIGILYIFTTYAVTVAFGPDNFATFTTSGESSWEGIARQLYGLFWVLVFLAIVNSTIANANAGVNVSSRTAYAMGRIGVFPYALARIALRHRAPYVSVIVVSIATIVVALGLGFGYGPTTAFGMVGTGIVTLLVAIYIVANVTCIAYFLRRRRADFNVFLHLVVPILGVVAFVPPWLAAAGVPVFSFIPRLAPPVSYAGPAVAVWMVLGLVYLAWLYLRHPARVADVSRVHFDEESGQEPDQEAGGKPTPAPDLAMPA